MKNKQEYILYELTSDSRVDAFFKETLSSGKELSHLLYHDIQVDMGKIFSILPKTFDKNNIYNFQEGGKIKDVDTVKSYKMLLTEDSSTELTAEKIPNTDAVLANLIHEFLEKNSGICILEDAVSLSSDRFIHRLINERQIPIVTLGTSVYFCFSSNESLDLQKIQKAISICNSLWHFVCVFSTVDPIRVERQIDIATLTEIARNTSGIAVGAYDGESYLLWSNHTKFIEQISSM